MNSIKQKKILVVENDELVQRVITNHLTHAGYAVVNASDGLEGLKAAFKEKLDLVICETAMPEMNGIEVCKKLRALKNTATTPIIILSAGSDGGDKLNVQEAGAQSHLNKPFRKQDLLDSVTRLIEGESQNALAPAGSEEFPSDVTTAAEPANPYAPKDFEESLAEVYEEVAALYDLGPILNTIDNEEELLQEVIERAVSVIDARVGAVFTTAWTKNSDVAIDLGLSGESGQLFLRAGAGFSREKWRGFQVPRNGNVVDWVREMRKETIVTNIGEDTRFSGREYYPWETPSLLAVPIMNAKTILGVLILGQKLSGEVFTSSNAKLIKAFAAHLFFALESIRFLSAVRATELKVNEKVKKRIEVIERSRSVVAKLNEILERKLFVLTCLKELQTAVAPLFDPVEIFNEAVQILDRVMGVHGVALCLPSRKMIFNRGHKHATRKFWDNLLECVRSELPRVDIDDSSGWEMKSTGSFDKPSVEERDTGIFSTPIYIQSRCVLTLAIGRIQYGDFTEEERNFLTLFSHQFGLYIDGALLFLKTKELDQVKSEFISVASHELRTPMASIKSALSLLADGSLGGLNEEQQEFVGLMERNVNRLASLINDVLDFSRIESGRMHLVLHEVDMKELVEDVIRTLEPYAAEKKDSLTAVFADDRIIARCDGDKITQVLVNLAGNALNHNNDGTRITIEAEKTMGSIIIRVKDDGKGIPASEHKKIFDRFYQVQNNSTGGGKKGTGLGLAISKGLVEAHGAKLKLESKTGKGTCFSFKLESSEAQPWVVEKSHIWKMQSISLKAELYRKRVVLKFNGSFEDRDCASISKIGDEIIKNWGIFLVLDFSSLEYIASRGIGYLMELRTRSHRRGGSIAILNIAESVRKILKPMGILNIMPCHTDLNTALREVGN